jgi:hypothetical protein
MVQGWLLAKTKGRANGDADAGHIYRCTHGQHVAYYVYQATPHTGALALMCTLMLLLLLL